MHRRPIRTARAFGWVLAVLSLGLLRPSPARSAGYLWIGAENAGEGSIYRYNIASGIVDLVTSPSLPFGTTHWTNMATDGATLYIGPPDSHYIGFADPLTGVVSSSSSYSPTLPGHKEDGAYYRPNDTNWRMTFQDILYEVTRSGVLVRRFNLPAATPSLIGLEWVGGVLYSTDSGAANPAHIGVVNLTSDSTATFTAISWTSGGGPPGGSPGDSTAGLAYDQQDSVLYMATYSSTRLFRITFEASQARATLVTTLSSVGYPAGAIADGLGWQPPARTDVGGTASGSPFSLGATPDPFNELTRITFRLDERATVQLEVWDVTGRVVRRLFAGPLPADHHTVTWDGRDDRRHSVPVGVYFVRLATGSVIAQAKVVRVR